MGQGRFPLWHSKQTTAEPPAVLFDVTSQPDRVFLDAAGDDPQRPVRQRPLQPESLVWRRGHPGLDFLGRRQDDRHRFRVDGADLGVRLRRKER
jgi:hypothetical protein